MWERDGRPRSECRPSVAEVKWGVSDSESVFVSLDCLVQLGTENLN